MTLTQSQFDRTVKALAETERLIAKEQAYRLDLQKPAYLDQMTRHAEKLRNMIKDCKVNMI